MKLLILSAAKRQHKGRRQRLRWSAVIVLVVIGIVVVARRATHLVPVLINGCHPPTPSSDPTVAQFAMLDDVFARYPV
jgi:hypothetical protein